MNPFQHSMLVLRRRSVWEAVDSGILLWRKNFPWLMFFFVLPFALCAAALRFLPGNFVYFSYLILWWLKPLFDRPALHLVSRRFFGSPAPSRLRELFKGFGRIFRGLAGDLIWRRFSLIRGAVMPIRILERINRKQFKKRKKNLSAGGLSFCTVISILSFITEGILLLGEIFFAAMVFNIITPDVSGYVREFLGSPEIFIYTAFCINCILAESLYVCMGFSLYINSRVEIEGWDLQLLFQKFAGSNTVRRTAAAAALFFCLFFVMPHAAGTEEFLEETEETVDFFPEGFPYAPDGSLEKLEEILASKDFGSEKESWGIRFKESSEKKENSEEDLELWKELFSKMENIRLVFAFILRFLVAAVIAAVIIFAVYWLCKLKGTGIFRQRGRSYLASSKSQESPELLFAKAEDFIERGFLREAWAACLAGCIRACEKHRSVSFPADATEYGCLDLVRRALPDKASGFAELVQSWILFAYGGREPARSDFERSLSWGRSLLRGADEP